MSTPADEALEEFMGQLDAATGAVEQVASLLHDEGIHSYARPLEAASENLNRAFGDLAYEIRQHFLVSNAIDQLIEDAGGTPPGD